MLLSKQIASLPASEPQNVKEKNVEAIVIKQIAKTCHEVNRAYCLSLGDKSQKAWDEAPDWQRKSAISGVKFHMENPKATPKDSHENWLKDKEADGWKFGEKKDEKKKEHPCFVPYSKLPKEQKLKDDLFMSVVSSF